MIADISEVLLELGIFAAPSDSERAVTLTALQRANSAVKRYLHYDPEYKTHTEYYPQGTRLSPPYSETWEVNATHAYIRRQSYGASDELYVQHIPIRSITSLHIDYDGRSGAKTGAFAAETLKVLGEDFWPNYDGVDSSGVKICRDGILRSIGLWSEEPGSVKIVYVAGYTESELHGQDEVIDASPILDCVIQEASRRARRAFTLAKSARTGFVAGPFTSENLGDYSYSIDTALAAKLIGNDSSLTQESMDNLSSFRNLAYDLAG